MPTQPSVLVGEMKTVGAAFSRDKQRIQARIQNPEKGRVFFPMLKMNLFFLLTPDT